MNGDKDSYPQALMAPFALQSQTTMLPSVTEGVSARKSFVGRHKLIRHFAAYLNAPQPRPTVLFLHGIAGSGKSLLMRFLHDRCCNRLEPDNWKYLDSLDDEQFASQFAAAQAVRIAPHAFVDFALPPSGDDRPREPFSALLMVRRQFGAALATPLFDFACLWYLKKSEQLTQERVRKLFRGPGIDLVAAIYDAISKTKAGAISKAVLGVIDREIGDWVTFWPHKRHLTPEDIEEIQQLSVEGDLIELLPEVLGRDLNCAFARPDAPQRAVLFVDSHESLLGHATLESDYVRLQTEEWLRRLLVHAPIGRLVAVIAGQNPPSWSTAARFPIPQSYVDLQNVPLFSHAEAVVYLSRVGVEKIAEQTTAIQIALVEDQVHPLYLGLAADATLASRSRGESLNSDALTGTPELKSGAKQILQRLLRAASREEEFAVRSLALCRGFDETVFRYLGDNLRFSTTAASLEAITALSVVSASLRQGRNWYQVHGLVQRLVEEGDQETANRTHRLMQRLYKDRMVERDPVVLAEMIYHENRLARKAGCDTWCGFFSSALNSVEYDTLRALLEVKPDLLIPDDVTSGNIAMLTGRYHVKIGGFARAREQFSYGLACSERALGRTTQRAEAAPLKGLCLQGLAECAAAAQNYKDAMKLYRQALSAYDLALRECPKDHSTRVYKAVLCKTRAQLFTWRGEYGKAILDLRQGIEILDQIIASDDDPRSLLMTIRERAECDQSLANILGRLGRDGEAKTAFESAIKSLDLLLEIDSEDIVVWHTKAVTLSNLGDLQAKLGQLDEMRITFERSVEAAKVAFDRAPGDVLAQNQLAVNLSSLGQAQLATGFPDEAQRSTERAILLFDELISRVEDAAGFRTNASNAYCAAGVVRARRQEYQAAITLLKRAVEFANSAIALTPHDVYGHNARGVAEVELARSLALSGDTQNARGALEAAAYSFGQALLIAPTYEKARRNLDAVLGMQEG
jgi:tetratricopeptide (TPR) repeat protein